MKVKARYAVGLVAVLLALLMAQTAYSQLASNEVYANTAFKLEATHDGLYTTEYRLIRDGVQVAVLPVSARNVAANTITFDVTGLPIGSYVYRMDAKGDGGVTPSANLTVVSKALPPVPNSFGSPIRLIRIP